MVISMLFNWNKKEPEKEKAQMDYVKQDAPKSIEKDAVIKNGIFSASHKWARGTQSIARTMSKSEMGGFFSKNIVLHPNEVAAIVQDGRVAEVVDGGKVRVGGLLKTDGYNKDVEAVIMDTSPKDANWKVGELWTSDQHEVSARGLMRYRIAEPQKFFSMVYAYSTIDKKGERFLSLEDINQRIRSEVLTRVLQPEANAVEIENIYGNRELAHKIENELELQLKQTLTMWGLELLTFTSEWDLGDYTSIKRARSRFDKDEELKELDTLGKEGDIERIGRVGVADVRSQHAVKSEVSEFQRRQKIRDAETGIQITQKESESDFDEAKRGVETYRLWKQAKTEARKAEVGIDQELADKEQARDLERMRTLADKGGADVARVMAEGREYARMSPGQLEALAKVRESEARVNDAKMMNAAKPNASGSAKKCPHCGSTVPMHAGFCGECCNKSG